MINALISSGDISNDFAGWPADYTDINARKVVILMTDGRNTKQRRVNTGGYSTQTPAYWNSNVVPNSSPNWIEHEVDNDNDGGVGDTYLHNICNELKTHQNTIVYTIGFELGGTPEGQAAETVLRGCRPLPVP